MDKSTKTTAKQRFQQLLDKMPNDATPEQLLDMLDTWYHIDKAQANDKPAIPHEQAKKIMAERLSIKDINDLINRLPEDITLKQFKYHLHILREIRKGLADLDSAMSIDEALEKANEWRKRGRP